MSTPDPARVDLAAALADPYRHADLLAAALNDPRGRAAVVRAAAAAGPDWTALAAAAQAAGAAAARTGAASVYGPLTVLALARTAAGEPGAAEVLAEVPADDPAALLAALLRHPAAPGGGAAWCAAAAEVDARSAGPGPAVWAPAPERAIDWFDQPLFHDPASPAAALAAAVANAAPPGAAMVITLIDAAGDCHIHVMEAAATGASVRAVAAYDAATGRRTERLAVHIVDAGPVDRPDEALDRFGDAVEAVPEVWPAAPLVDAAVIDRAAGLWWSAADGGAVRPLPGRFEDPLDAAVRRILDTGDQGRPR